MPVISGSVRANPRFAVRQNDVDVTKDSVDAAMPGELMGSWLEEKVLAKEAPKKALSEAGMEAGINSFIQLGSSFMGGDIDAEVTEVTDMLEQTESFLTGLNGVVNSLARSHHTITHFRF